MGRILYTNNAQSVVAAALLSTGTSIVLETGAGALFPNPSAGDYFKLTLEDRRENPVKREIVHCTARSGDTLTISRAKEGFTAKNFNAGFVASLRMTAGAAQALSDAAAGFTSLWLGVKATPPMTDNDGNPLQVGALYFDSTTNLNYAWDGIGWRAQLAIGPAVASRLYYVATAAQTQFGDTNDLNGNTLTLTVLGQQPVLVFKNGRLLFEDDGSGTVGEYTVDHANNRIDLLVGAALNDLVELQQLASAASGTGVVDAQPLTDIDLDPADNLTPGWITGSRATFKLRDGSGNPITPDSAYALVVYLDGVPQQPAVAYSVATDEITFDENLPAGTKFWGIFYASMVA